ncbi:MAG: diguanylate cyclase [Fibrobacterota bacterium]|nr:diguanylate cyclase [Fibrobacterota bacterium]QQS03082.1 MAG: diguanylate cyclase [Fibrobacterota bacterium]
MAEVLRILVQSAPKDGEAGRASSKLAKICDRWGRGANPYTEIPSLVEEQRKAEKEWFESNVRGLAEAVLGVLRRLGKAAGSAREEGKSLGSHLEDLRTATKTESLEDLRRTVMAAVEQMTEELRTNQERQNREMSLISGQLENLKGELSRVRKEATLDGLTRVANRASLDEHLDAVLSVHRITGRPCSLLMVDIDHFKAVNDRLGHPAGDAALRAVADCLVRCFPRRSDFVGRYGGEEFCIVLSEDGPLTGKRLAERFVQTIRALEIVWPEETFTLTVSVGIAEPANAESAADWIAAADRMLYRAKDGGRDRVVCTGEPDSKSD